ncbi:hypothetical protein [Streptomyces pseudogriseolus]|uniref:hypothetical protein n=1 Tax=Streptomyces pseudogriseolus TaxID=36817 RepID=UPI003FA1AADA
MPRDTAQPRDANPAVRPVITGGQTPNTAAAADLRALCETVVRHTPATAVAAFITDQVPEPRSALVLACVLQLTDTDDGARFWWQYAAGAGQPAAALLAFGVLMRQVHEFLPSRQQVLTAPPVPSAPHMTLPVEQEEDGTDEEPQEAAEAPVEEPVVMREEPEPSRSRRSPGSR